MRVYVYDVDVVGGRVNLAGVWSIKIIFRQRDSERGACTQDRCSFSFFKHGVFSRKEDQQKM